MLEQIVRPFQSRLLFSERRVPSSSVKAAVEPSGVTWGNAGAMPAAVESAEPGPAAPINFIVKGLNQRNVQDPSADQMERVKIQQEGNPDNFVIYERPKKLTFNDPKPQPLKSVSTPPGTNAPASGPTGFVPGPGDPQEIPLDRNITRREDEEVLRNITRPEGEEVLSRNQRRPEDEEPIKFTTHEYQFSYPAPGPNETIEGGAGS